MSNSKSTQEWLLKTVHFFRQLDFFEAHHALSDEDLLAEFIASMSSRVVNQLDLILAQAPADLDCILLSLDKTRVWENDIEAGVCPEYGVYVQTLTEWGAISRGTFSPKAVREHWTSENGPIRIMLTHQEQVFELHPQYLGDAIDIKILTQVNTIIADTGIQFAAYNTGGQNAFVVALKHDEREKLEREHGWRFLGL
jgi:hypothetical protein